MPGGFTAPSGELMIDGPADCDGVNAAAGFLSATAVAEVVPGGESAALDAVADREEDR